MSERPGPSPEELGNPEQAEAYNLYRQGLESIRRIVNSHPNSFVEYEDQLVNEERIEVPTNKRLELTDFGAFGRVQIWLEGEAGDEKSKGGIEFLERGRPGEDRDEYNFMQDNEISYYSDEESKTPTSRIDMQTRRELMRQISTIEHELQQRGEI